MTEVQKPKIKETFYHHPDNQVTNYEGNHLVVELKWMTQSRDSHHHCKLLSPASFIAAAATWMSLSSPPLVVKVLAIVCQVPLGGHLISSSSHHQVLNCLRCPMSCPQNGPLHLLKKITGNMGLLCKFFLPTLAGGIIIYNYLCTSYLFINESNFFKLKKMQLHYSRKQMHSICLA